MVGWWVLVHHGPLSPLIPSFNQCFSFLANWGKISPSAGGGATTTAGVYSSKSPDTAIE